MKKLLLTVVALSAVVFMACGDDDSSPTKSDNSWPLENTPSLKEWPASVEDMGDLPPAKANCTADKRCKSIYVKAMDTDAVCNGEGGWAFMSLAEALGCEAK